MNTNDFFAQLKRISPDPDYSRKSRLLIMGEAPASAPAFIPHLSLGKGEEFTLGGLVANILKSGSAIALSAALLLLLAGSFSLWKFFVPQGTALLDPAGLRAEAQAIDIQIQLSNLAYPEPNLANETSSPAIAPKPNGMSPDVQKEAQAEAEHLGIAAPASSSPNVSIDEALDRLSQ